MTPEAFALRFREARASAILRTDDQTIARQAMEAAVRGGARIVEFTLTVPGALELIGEFSRRDLVVGAGTVLSPEQAREAVRAGAQFLVSPVADEAVIAEARALGVASMPGAFTPAEMLRAHRAGATLVKLFPAPGTGPTYVRQVLGPLPFLKIVPTAGVDASNAAAYLAAGCWGLGLVTWLFAPDDLAAGRFDRVEERARTLFGSLR